MPILNLATLNAEIVTNIIPRLNNQLRDAYYNVGIECPFVMARDGALNSLHSVAKPGFVNPHPTGLFTVTFETAPEPKLRDTVADDGVTIKNVTLHYNGDRSLLPPKTRTKFYFQRRPIAHPEYRKIADRLMELGQRYVGGIQSIEAKKTAAIMAAKAASDAEIRLEEKKKKYKATEIQRESLYEELVANLGGMGKIESEIKSGYMNLRLDNDIRVKIAIDAERAYITEIDTPVYFDRKNIGSIVAYLQRVAKL